ncbi:MAG: C4-dicarboxylate ABC transporter substrate-binding protein [Alphaproteobacteria bacterium]|nr:C4-dicarboxylate ABC transporter substrate-binding protein [Alphaproteobacteria bacterium]
MQDQSDKGGIRLMAKPRICAFAAVGAIALLAGAPASAQQVTMKLAHPSSIGEAHTTGHEIMKAEIEAASNGRVKMEIFPNAQLGNFRQTLEQTQIGTIEAVYTSGGGVGQVIPEIQAFDIPYITPNDRVAEAMMDDSELLKFVNDESYKKTGNIRLAQIWSTGGWRSFYTVQGPIKTAADLKGMKIRTVESPIPMEFVRALGANATPIPWQELYTSFATKVVNGTMNNVGDLIPNNFHEFLKFGIVDQHAPVWAFSWVNAKWWEGVPTDLKKIIIDGFYTLRVTTANMAKERNMARYKEFEKAGGKVYFPTAEERATFFPAAKVVRDWYTGKYGDSWVKQIEASRTRAEAKVVAYDAVNLK